MGNEFNNEQMDGLFACNHCLESLRFLVHEPAAVRSNDPLSSKVMMINDAARAFLEAPVVRNVCVEIPAEDKEEAEIQD